MSEENLSNSKSNDFDIGATRILTGLAKRCTRRGVIFRVGRILLRITGVGIVPLLPLDRMIPEVEAQSSCTDAHLCGICGRLCGCCGGNLYNCPAGCPRTSFWSCCCVYMNPAKIYNYYDCCERNTSNCASCANCTFCQNNCPQPVWCGDSTLTYRCTSISFAGYC
jgi:hypothetical protein